MKFIIPITWKMQGQIEVEASSIEDAHEKVLDFEPKGGKLIKNSVELDYDLPHFENCD